MVSPPWPWTASVGRQFKSQLFTRLCRYQLLFVNSAISFYKTQNYRYCPLLCASVRDFMHYSTLSPDTRAIWIYNKKAARVRFGFKISLRTPYKKSDTILQFFWLKLLKKLVIVDSKMYNSFKRERGFVLYYWEKHMNLKTVHVSVGNCSLFFFVNKLLLGTVRNNICSYFVSLRQISKWYPPPRPQKTAKFVSQWCKNEQMFFLLFFQQIFGKLYFWT